MPVTPSSYASLHRILLRDITLESVAEYLVSLDAGAPPEEFRRVRQEMGFAAIGARAEGVVMGYVVPDESDDVQFIDPEQILPHDAPLHLAIRALDTFPRVFVSTLGGVTGIVTRDDLEKPPARMWVFGIVTLIETGLRRVVEKRHPDDDWTGVLSKARTEQAQSLQAERARRGEEVPLLDCVQFHDLANLAARHEDVRQAFGHESRRSMEARMKEWAKLRNHIAHSQGYVQENWQLLARVSNNAGQGGLARLLDMM
jgi:hypothetical protein